MDGSGYQHAEQVLLYAAAASASSGFYAFENSVHLTSVQPGVIETNYRGEVKIVLTNDSKDQIFEIKPGVSLAMGVL